MDAVASNRDINKIIQSAAKQMPLYVELISTIAQSIEGFNKINIKSLNKGVVNAEKVSVIIGSYMESLNKSISELSSIQSVNAKDLASKISDISGKNGLIGDEKSGTGIMGLLSGFSEISDNILSMTGKIIKVKMFSGLIIFGIKQMLKIAVKVADAVEKSGLNQKQIDTKWATNLNIIIDSVKSVSISLIKLAFLIPVAMISAAMVMSILPIFVILVLSIMVVLKTLSLIDLSRVYIAIKNLISVLRGIKTIIYNLLITALLMPIGLIAGMIVVLGITMLGIILLSISLILYGLGTLISNLKLPKLVWEIVKLLIVLNLILLFMLTTAILMLMIVLVVENIDFDILWEFMGQLALVLIAIIVVGYLLSLISTILAPAAIFMIAAVAVIAIVVGVMLLIAVELWLLQNIYIDKKAIETNVKKIMETVFMILETVFNSVFEMGGGDKTEPWYKQVLSFMGGAVKTMITAILSVGLLALTLVAIGLILFIAINLYLLQQIDLDQEKIKTNVSLIIETAFMVIDSIFGSPETPTSGTPEDWFSSVLKWAGGTFLIIIKAILSVVFLALTLVSITLILFLVGELRLLQIVDLNPGKIKENVEIVTDTAFMVIDSIFGSPSETSENGQSKSWFESVLSWFGGTFITIIKAILSVAFLALILVSITLILLIAGELRILQTVYLDEKLIKENVNKVIDTAQMVSSSIFDKTDDKKDDPSSKGFFIDLLSKFAEPWVNLFNAIMSMAYLALTLVSILLIIFIAKQLTTLMSIELDQVAIEANVSMVISTAQMVSSSIFDPSDDKEDKPSSKGFFLDLMNFFSPGLTSIVEAIMSIGYLALTVVAISLVIEIANQLKQIAELNLDTATIQKNTDAVIKAAKHVIDAVIRPDDSKPKEAKDVFKKILRMVLPGNLLDMIDALMAIGFLALAKSAVGLVGEIAQNLTTIANLPSMNGITGKTDTIIDSARSVINKIINKGGGISDKDAKKLSGAGDYIGKLINTIRVIGNLSKEVNNVQTVKKEKVTQTQQSIDLVVGLIDSIAAKSKSDIKVTDKKLHQMNNMMRVIERINKITPVDVQNSEAILRNYSQFIDKVSNSNLDNLKTTTHMFAKMAEFSKSIHGDFDALADTINEKIAPLLEDLKKIMEDVHTKIEKTGSDISSSVYASSQDSLSPAEMSKQIEREMPNSSKEEQQEALQRKLEAQAQRQNNNIVDKLDELIELFETGRARMRNF